MTKDIDRGGLGYAFVLKGEQKAVVVGLSELYEIKLPSLLTAKEKTFVFDSRINGFFGQNSSLYVLLNHKQIIKINAENFQEREVILERDFEEIALSKNGEIAIFSSEGNLILKNLQSSSQQEVKFESDDDIRYGKFSNNQSKILVAFEKSVIIIKVNPLEVVKKIELKAEIYSIIFGNDENALIIGDENGKVTFWDINNNELLSEIQVHSKFILYLGISDDGKTIYSSGRDGKFCLFRYPEFTKELSTKAVLLSTSPLGASFIESDFYFNFTKWDLATSKTEYLGRVISNGFFHQGVIDDNTFILISFEEIIKYNIKTGEKIEIPLTEDNVDTIVAWAFSPDRTCLATGGEAQKVYLWDLKTMKKIKEFKGSDNYIFKIMFLPQLNYIVAGNHSGSVYFWNIDNEELITSLKGEKDIDVKALSSFNNEKNVVIGYENGAILVFNWNSKTLLTSLKAGGEIINIHIVKDGQTMIVASKDGKICFWNLLTFNQLFHYDIKQEILCFALTADEKYFAYQIEIKEGEENKNAEENKEKKEVHNIFFKKNPLFSETVIAAGSGNKFEYMKYVLDLINGKGRQHKPEYDKWVIMPYRINTLHLYAYFNHHNQLKAAIDAGGSLFDTNFNENPLSFAIQKKFSGCVSVIVSSFGKLLKGNPYALNFISEDCIFGLNRLGYPSLSKFYKLIYTPYKGKFTKFVSESTSTPIYYLSKEIYPLEENFLQQGQSKKEGKPIKCMVASLTLPLTNWSKASTDFLDSLEECPNSAIFTTKLIQDILDNKWDELKWVMYWQAIIYTIYMILLSIYILYWIGESLPLLVIFLFSLLLTSYEVFQFVASPSEYIEDIWNYVDGIRTILTAVYAAIVWLEGKHTDLSYDILVGLVIISWMRGITYFRIFKNTRYMVNLITQVIIDIISFLILLFYSTLAFAFIFLVMDRDDPKLIDYIKMSYRLETSFNLLKTILY